MPHKHKTVILPVCLYRKYFYIEYIYGFLLNNVNVHSQNNNNNEI